MRIIESFDNLRTEPDVREDLGNVVENVKLRLTMKDLSNIATWFLALRAQIHSKARSKDDLVVNLLPGTFVTV